MELTDCMSVNDVLHNGLSANNAAPVPPYEAARLALLRRYGILDTPPELAFDDLARIAALICGTPMSAVSIVDADRQWFKASVGLGVSETPRDQAFCAHTIVTPSETLVVTDARRDPRFADNPLVTGSPGIRFYAGAPLVTAEGHALGSLCVIDTEPRVLSPEQLQGLEALSRLVMGQLEARRSVGVLSVAFAEWEVAATAARDHEERFRLAFEKSSVGMALVSPEGRLLQVNDRYCRLVGRSESELVGVHFTEVSHPDFRKAELSVQQRLLSGAAQVGVREKRYLRPDGGVSWGNATTSLVRSPQGAALYFISQIEDITERKLAEQAFHQTQSVGDALVSVDAHGRITAWNPSAETMFGYRQEAMLGQPLTKIMPPRHRKAHRRGFASAVTTTAPPFAGRVVEMEALRRDGTEFPVELSVGRSQLADAVSFTAVIRDITQRRQSELALRRRTAFIELLHEVAAAANAASTAEQAMRYALRRVCELTGWTVGHLLDLDGEGYLRSSGLWWMDDPERFQDFRRLTQAQRYRCDEGPGRVVASRAPVWMADGTEDPSAPRAQLGTRLGLEDGVAFPVLIRDEVVAVLEFFSDRPIERDPDVLKVMAQVGTQLGRVIERTRADDRLVRQALHDPMTGLPNRALLLDRLRQALAGAARHNRSVATLFIDLDRFQLVNDSLGHAGGDELLVHAARRIESVVRIGDTVARVGGDEFAVLCADLADPTEAMRVAQRAVDAFTEPFALPGGEVFVSVSVGIASAGTAASPEGLIREADAAMHRAKDLGRNRYQASDGALGADAARRLSTETGLHRALERREFRLLYQPTVVLADGTIEGVEALLRWDHPERGLVPPDEFIPLLEANGLIEPVGAWVLHKAAVQLGQWRQEFGANLALRMAVNLSARQVGQSDLVDVVRHALAAADLPADRLTLEITETVSMQDTEATLARLWELRHLGVQLAIDDFGTGYSSLGYLHRLPIDVLKIDRAFVAPISSGGAKTAIVDAIVDVGHALGLAVLAEGIETEEQAAYLRSRGCDLGQGYLFACPLSSEAVTALLRSRPQHGGESDYAQPATFTG